MQLREIHIDGFGAAENVKLTGLAPGINVLYGPNEYGKSTIMEFVRRILFGFYTPAKGNKYLAEGKQYGGRLQVETSQGKKAVIARTKGTHGGPVTVAMENELLNGDAAVKELLGHASKDLFNNVYAFTLDELQDLGSLGAEDVKNRIYGAGIGLNRISLTRVIEELNKEKGSFFKSSGSKPRINTLHKEYESRAQEIRRVMDNLPAYDRCVAERSALSLRFNELEEKRAGDEKLKRDLETRLELFPIFLRLEEVRRELEALGPQVVFRENTHELHGKLKEEMSGTLRQMKEETDRLKQLQNRHDHLEIPKAFLEKSHEVEWMRQKIEQVRSAGADLVVCRHDYDRAEDQIQADIQTLDPDWDEDKVKHFTLTGADLAEAEEFTQSLSSLEQQARDVKSRLDYHRQQEAAKVTDRHKIPGWLNPFIYGFAAVGAGMLIASVVLASIGLALGGVIVGVLSGLMIFKIRKNTDDFQTEDVTEANLQREHQAAVEARDLEHERWRDWAGAKGLARHNPPHKIELIWNRIREIQKLISDREDLGQRIKEMQTTLDEAEANINRIAPDIPGFNKSSDLVANLSMVCKSWDQVREREDERRQLEQRIEDQAGRIARLKEQLAVAADAKAALINEAGVTDEDEFARRYELFQKQNRLAEQLQESRRRIEERVGIGGGYKLFVESLASTQPPELEAELARVEQRVQENRSECNALRESMGKLEGEAERLVSEDALLEHQVEQESLRVRLNHDAREWAKRAMAEAVLKRAKERYETTRQPGVVRAAAERFARITEGQYPQIIKPLEEDDLFIQDGDGRVKGVVEMSRGTREQLYLSLRLGLIEEYESRAEPLPIIMDDVFVNFDDDRKPRVLDLLKEFSATRQVLLMTCHRETRELCLAHGACAIEW